MLALEERHGVETGTTYPINGGAAIFVIFIAFVVAATLKHKVAGVSFISAFTEVSIDAAIIDQEAVFVRYLNSNPSGLDQVKISTNFVSIEDV